MHLCQLGGPLNLSYRSYFQHGMKSMREGSPEGGVCCSWQQRVKCAQKKFAFRGNACERMPLFSLRMHLSSRIY